MTVTEFQAYTQIRKKIAPKFTKDSVGKLFPELYELAHDRVQQMLAECGDKGRALGYPQMRQFTVQIIVKMAFEKTLQGAELADMEAAARV